MPRTQTRTGWNVLTLAGAMAMAGFASGADPAAPTVAPALSGADHAAAPAQHAAATFAQRYSIVTEQNIFLRDRSHPSRSGPATQKAPLSIEQSYVLTGVVQEDGQYHAYFEDLNRTQILRISTGDALGRGKVAQIDIDAVDYELNAQHTWIEVGDDLTGQQSVAVSGAATDGGEKIDPNDPNLTLEQKMKLRRMQQLGK